MNQKVIIVILVIAVVALAGTTMYFAAAQKLCAEQTAQILAGVEQARLKAQKASIKSYMASAVPSGIMCEDGQKAIMSGNGDAKVCVGEDFTWPAIKACGDNASDTKWTVRNGAGTNWDFTLDCKGFTDCNGPQNAICNATTGCKFSGSCQ
jgi:hypothetical protein